MDWLEVIPVLCVAFPVSWLIQFVITRYCAKKDKRIDDIAEIKKLLEKHDKILEKNSEDISKINGALDIIKDAVKDLLREEILTDSDRLKEAGKMTVAQRDSLHNMYDEYHALGGNGTITKVVNDLDKELSVVSEIDNKGIE